MSNIDRISLLDNNCFNGIFMRKLSFDEYDSLSDKYFELRDRLLVLLKKHNRTPCKLGEFTTLYSVEYKDLIRDYEDLEEKIKKIN